MIIDDDTLFDSVDDFCQSFEPWYKNQLVCNDKKKKRKRKGHLKLSEVLTILIVYHQSGMSSTQILLSRSDLISTLSFSQARP